MCTSLGLCARLPVVARGRRNAAARSARLGGCARQPDCTTARWLRAGRAHFIAHTWPRTRPVLAMSSQPIDRRMPRSTVRRVHVARQLSSSHPSPISPDSADLVAHQLNCTGTFCLSDWHTPVARIPHLVRNRHAPWNTLLYTSLAEHRQKAWHQAVLDSQREDSPGPSQPTPGTLIHQPRVLQPSSTTPRQHYLPRQFVCTPPLHRAPSQFCRSCKPFRGNTAPALGAQETLQGRFLHTLSSFKQRPRAICRPFRGSGRKGR